MASEWHWWNYLLMVVGASGLVHSTYPWLKEIPTIPKRLHKLPRKLGWVYVPKMGKELKVR